MISISPLADDHARFGPHAEGPFWLVDLGEQRKWLERTNEPIESEHDTKECDTRVMFRAQARHAIPPLLSTPRWQTSRSTIRFRV
jgi:hypothetical protein